MSHTQVRANEATTNHEENNYGLFSLSADARTTSGSNLLFYVMVGIAVLGIFLHDKSCKASRTTNNERWERKAKSTQKAMRSRRVVLNDSPNSNTRTGTYCG